MPCSEKRYIAESLLRTQRSLEDDRLRTVSMHNPSPLMSTRRLKCDRKSAPKQGNGNWSKLEVLRVNFRTGATGEA